MIYRMCDLQSTNPSPILQENKFELNKLCLKSFVGGVKDITPETYFICDYCGKEYDNMIRKIYPWYLHIEHTEIGINETMNKAYNIARKINDYVLLQECDYLYLPNAGKTLLAAMEQLGIVSPYDHPNFYKERDIHSSECEIELVNNHHFRTTERNTMTWGCHGSLIEENADTLLKYGYLDDVVWQELMYAGHPLWTPIPALATHMVADCLAPGVNWRQEWQKYQSQ